MERLDRIKKDLDDRGLLKPALDIAIAHYVTLDELLGRTRTPSAVRARRAFWLELRELGMSYPHIAKLCGVDHTTVLYGVRVAELGREAA